jgi:hypothetical protein
VNLALLCIYATYSLHEAYTELLFSQKLLFISNYIKKVDGINIVLSEFYSQRIRCVHATDPL